jgi:hypothetical protein
MDEDYIRHRVDQILRQRIAMGGCGGDDYMGYGEGVLVGGRRRRGGVNIGGYGTLKGAKKNPWFAYVEKYADKYGRAHNLARRDVLASAGFKQGYPAFKKTFKPTIKRKVVAPKRKVTPRRAFPSPPALTKRERMRVGHRYRTKVKSGPHKDSCIKPDNMGDWYLDAYYNCVPYTLNRKKKR